MSKLLLLLMVTLFSVNSFAKFSNESELGVIQTGGNASSESYNVKTLNTLAAEKNTYKIGGHYTVSFAEDLTSGDDVETSRNWDIFANYERSLTNKISGVAGLQVEGNEFAGFEKRTNADVGAKYSLIKNDDRKLFLELGVRQVNEQFLEGSDPESVDFMAGRFYIENEQKHSETLSSRIWVEYVPNFDESEDYRIVFEPSFSVVLTNMFSLKMAYKGMYDNEPAAQGAEYLDYIYTTSLIAKF